MSHEVRTPMNAILGMGRLLLRGELEGEDREHAEIVVTSAEALLTIINDILDFSKIEAGKLEMEAAQFNIRTALEDTMDVLATRAAEKGVELSLNVPPEAPEIVVGDPGRFRQIILNLAGNAIKFTDEGEVAVRAYHMGVDSDGVSHWKIAVRDEGIGIAPEHLTRLFRSFSQVDASTSRKFGGTGLGLAISPRLAELMGGAIKVVSEPGRGSVFTVELKLRRVGELVRELEWPPPLQGRSVVLISPWRGARHAAARQFGQLGLTVVPVTTIRELRGLLERPDLSPPSAFVLDLDMPHDGAGLFLELIRGDRDGAASPVVGISRNRGEVSDELLSRTQCVISKPLRLRKLKEALGGLFAGENNEDAVPENVIDEVFAETSSDGAAEEAAAPLKILLAEDNLVNQKLALKLLEIQGRGADVAANGRETVELWLEGGYDVILMDCQMPEMSGFEATAEIREREREGGRPVRIIALTANAMEGDRRKCLDAGMDDYLSKPIDPDKLAEALDKAEAELRDWCAADHRA